MISVKVDPNMQFAAEAGQFIEELLQEHQLTNTSSLKFHIKGTKNKLLSGKCYDISKTDFNEQAHTSIEIGLPGSPVTLEYVYFTIAHEYCHAMQYDRRCDLVNTKGKKKGEIHADLFGLQKTAERIGTSIEAVRKHVNIYQQTKDHLNAHTTLEEALTHCPPLDSMKPWK